MRRQNKADQLIKEHLESEEQVASTKLVADYAKEAVHETVEDMFGDTQRQGEAKAAGWLNAPDLESGRSC